MILKWITSFNTVLTSVYVHLIFTPELSGHFRGQQQGRSEVVGGACGCTVRWHPSASHAERNPGAECSSNLDYRDLSSLSRFWALVACSRKIGNISLTTSHYHIKRRRRLVFTGLDQQGIFVIISTGIIQQETKHNKPQFLLYLIGNCF